jgi:hypothetical protein
LAISYPPLDEQMRLVAALASMKQKSYDLENIYRRKRLSLARTQTIYPADGLLRSTDLAAVARDPRGRRVNEAETRAELIDPALRSVGWGVVADIRRALRRKTTEQTDSAVWTSLNTPAYWVHFDPAHAMAD